MSTWSAAQVTEAASCSAEWTVAAEVMATTCGDAGKQATLHACSELADKLRTLDLEVDVRDIHVQEWTDVATESVHLRVFWMPATKTAELTDGARDGEQVQVPVVGNLIITSPAPMAENSVLQMGPAALDSLLVYRLVGWNPAKRCWVYKLVPQA